MILLSGSSNRLLAQKIAKAMGQPLGKTELSTFKNGERRVHVTEEVKGQDIGLIQSFSEPADSYIIEFALIMDALFRLGARRVFAVIPWFGYSLQDKAFRPGEPIASKVIASMLSSQSVYRFILMDLHNNSISGFFSVPSSVLSSDALFISDIKKQGRDVVLVSSDFGGLKRVGRFAEKMKLPMANIDKRRDLVSGQVVAFALAGDVAGKNVVIVDDLINGGSTAVEAARILRENGAKHISIYAAHAIFADNCAQRLQESEIDEVIVTDTIDVSTKQFPKLRVLSVASIIASELKLWAR